MLKISKMADYSLQIMLALMKQPGLLSAARIADQTAIAETTVGKLLKILADAGLLESMQGSKGGYQLAKSPEKVMLAELISAVDGPLALTECSKSRYTCAQDHVCTQQRNWRTISHMIFSLLNSISLKDMGSPLL